MTTARVIMYPVVTKHQRGKEAIGSSYAPLPCDASSPCGPRPLSRDCRICLISRRILLCAHTCALLYRRHRLRASSFFLAFCTSFSICGFTFRTVESLVGTRLIASSWQAYSHGGHDQSRPYKQTKPHITNTMHLPQT